MHRGQQGREKRDPDVVEEIELKTGFASLAARGIRISDIVTVIATGLTAFGVGVLLSHAADAKDEGRAVRAAMSEHSKAIRAQTRVICIVLQPKHLQREEMENPNSFCRRMADLP